MIMLLDCITIHGRKILNRELGDSSAGRVHVLLCVRPWVCVPAPHRSATDDGTETCPHPPMLLSLPLCSGGELSLEVTGWRHLGPGFLSQRHQQQQDRVPRVTPLSPAPSRAELLCPHHTGSQGEPRHRGVTARGVPSPPRTPPQATVAGREGGGGPGMLLLRPHKVLPVCSWSPSSPSPDRGEGQEWEAGPKHTFEIPGEPWGALAAQNILGLSLGPVPHLMGPLQEFRPLGALLPVQLCRLGFLALLAGHPSATPGQQSPGPSPSHSAALPDLHSCPQPDPQWVGSGG